MGMVLPIPTEPVEGIKTNSFVAIPTVVTPALFARVG